MGRWRDLTRMISERRVGFLLDETMKGTHTFVRDFPPGKVKAGTTLPFRFNVTWGSPHLSRFLNPLSDDFMYCLMEGTVSAGGIGGDLPLKGSLELRYFKDASIRYTFEFEGMGRSFRFEGAKTHIRPWNLHKTHTLCKGSLIELVDEDPSKGKVLSEVEVRFLLSHLPILLFNARLG